jgi:hypothetical protein
MKERNQYEQEKPRRRTSANHSRTAVPDAEHQPQHIEENPKRKKGIKMNKKNPQEEPKPIKAELLCQVLNISPSTLKKIMKGREESK